MLVDTHFHLDLMDNMQSLIKQFQGTNIGIIAVGTTPLAYKQELRFCAGIDNITVGLGFHPQLVEQRAHEIDLFLRELKDANFIGEIGLDFNRGYINSKTQQLSYFRRICETCAAEGEKVLSIHSVKAASAVIDILEETGTFHNCKCIFHWFTGTALERKSAIENGAYFSINSKMLKTKSGQETIRNLPVDRILLETDAPFIMKFQSVSNLHNELGNVAREISIIRGEDVISQIEENSMNLFQAYKK